MIMSRPPNKYNLWKDLQQKAEVAAEKNKLLVDRKEFTNDDFEIEDMEGRFGMLNSAIKR
jgi:hypothetical protein